MLGKAICWLSSSWWPSQKEQKKYVVHVYNEVQTKYSKQKTKLPESKFKKRKKRSSGFYNNDLATKYLRYRNPAQSYDRKPFEQSCNLSACSEPCSEPHLELKSIKQFATKVWKMAENTDLKEIAVVMKTGEPSLTWTDLLTLCTSPSTRVSELLQKCFLV